MRFFKKTSPRRSRLRKDKTAERFSQISRLADKSIIISLLIWLLFVVLSIPILSFELIQQAGAYHRMIPKTVIVVLVSFAAIFYIYR